MQTITLDEVGQIAAADGEGAALPGWHVNATHPVPGWDAWRVTPATPRRVFAGVPTVHYTFASQAEYTAARATAVLALPDAVDVPRVVTMRQARLALLGAGLLGQVEAAINALPEPPRTAARVEWDYSNEVHRDKAFVQMLGGALGLTTAQLDALFVAAGAL